MYEAQMILNKSAKKLSTSDLKKLKELFKEEPKFEDKCPVCLEQVKRITQDFVDGTIIWSYKYNCSCKRVLEAELRDRRRARNIKDKLSDYQ